MRIPRSVRDAMLDHLHGCAPLEGCGLLVGPAGDIVEYVPMRNADQSTHSYRIDDGHLVGAWDVLDALGWDLQAIVHSHPSDVAVPSATDRQTASYPDRPYVVVSFAQADPIVRAWRLPVQIEESIEWTP